MFRLTARKHQAFLDRLQYFASCKMSSSSRSDVCGKSSGSETLQFEATVKGLHECSFGISVGDVFELRRKIGSRGKAFEVLCSQGRVGHLEKDLVPVLWDLKPSTVLKG